MRELFEVVGRKALPVVGYGDPDLARFETECHMANYHMGLSAGYSARQQQRQTCGENPLSGNGSLHLGETTDLGEA